MTALSSTNATPDSYSIETHRHRFACWAAARAASQRLSGGKNDVLQKALETCGVVATLEGRIGAWPSRSDEYDDLHIRWCRGVLGTMADHGVSASYGRAAKLIAIYLKTTVIAAGYHDTDFGRILHPPIDEILLKTLAASVRFGSQARRLWRRTTWTKLDEVGYTAIIRSLRDEGLDSPAFWMVERYWHPDRAVASGAHLRGEE